MATSEDHGRTQGAFFEKVTVNLIVQPNVHLANTSFADLPLSTTVGALKSRICLANVEGPEPQRQRLIYRGTALSNDDTSLHSVFGDNQQGGQPIYHMHLAVRPANVGSAIPSQPDTSLLQADIQRLHQQLHESAVRQAQLQARLLQAAQSPPAFAQPAQSTSSSATQPNGVPVANPAVHMGAGSTHHTHTSTGPTTHMRTWSSTNNPPQHAAGIPINSEQLNRIIMQNQQARAAMGQTGLRTNTPSDSSVPSQSGPAAGPSARPPDFTAQNAQPGISAPNQQFHHFAPGATQTAASGDTRHLNMPTGPVGGGGYGVPQMPYFTPQPAPLSSIPQRFPLPQHGPVPQFPTQMFLLCSPAGPQALLLSEGHAYHSMSIPPVHQYSSNHGPFHGQEGNFLGPAVPSPSAFGPNATAATATTPANETNDPSAQMQPQRDPQQQAAAEAQAPERRQGAPMVNLVQNAAQHVWNLVRLFGIVYMLLGGGWQRNTVLVLIATLGFLIQGGWLGNFHSQILASIRSHLEGLLPDAAAEIARRREPGNPPAEPTPEAMAQRLERERRAANASWLNTRIRRIERALVIFVASIVPGISEGHVAAFEIAERARVQRELDATNQAEAELREGVAQLQAVSTAREAAEAAQSAGEAVRHLYDFLRRHAEKTARHQGEEPALEYEGLAKAADDIAGAYRGVVAGGVLATGGNIGPLKVPPPPNLEELRLAYTNQTTLSVGQQHIRLTELHRQARDWYNTIKRNAVEVEETSRSLAEGS